ncbi:MAG TPA: hypothetical protein VHM24_01610, partial [Gemmatimonadaceae bacterium]|nr:hypothetical protein [Gemmatimonadaceae bacterium]
MNRTIVSLIAAVSLASASPAVLAVAQAPAARTQAPARAAAGPAASANVAGIQRAPSAAAKPAA